LTVIGFDRVGGAQASVDDEVDDDAAGAVVVVVDGATVVDVDLSGRPFFRRAAEASPGAISRPATARAADETTTRRRN
jgi:hypothetical protein